MSTTLKAKPQLKLGIALAAVLACVVVSLGFTQQANAAIGTIPAPDVLSGPLQDEIITTDSASFVFGYVDGLTGGSILGYVCTLDAVPIPCTSSLDLLGLSAGVHVVGVRASVLPLGGQEVCVLTLCLTLPALAVDTDLLTRTFNVDLSGTSVGTDPTPPTGGSSSTTTNNTTSNVNSDKLGAFALAWGKYKRQQTKCNAMKKRIKKYKSHKNRMRAAKRYKSCVKTQKKLRAQAIAIAR
jgi:hypothetical protein